MASSSSSSLTNISDEKDHAAPDALTTTKSIDKANPPNGVDVEKAPTTVGNEAENPPGPMDPRSFPDGGLEAWLVVSGAFACLFCSFGWINAIGIFQTYYETHQLKNYSPSDIAWIPSLETFMMFAGGPICGKIFDNYGPRWLLLIGSFLNVFGLMMTSLW